MTLCFSWESPIFNTMNSRKEINKFKENQSAIVIGIADSSYTFTWRASIL